MDTAVAFRFVRSGEARVFAWVAAEEATCWPRTTGRSGPAVPPLLPEPAKWQVTHERGRASKPHRYDQLGRGVFEATLMPAAKASNVDVVLYHTSFGGGPGARMMGDVHGRARRQAESLGRVQSESGTPLVVAIRPATTGDAFELSSEFQEACWRQGLALPEHCSRGTGALKRHQMAPRQA